MANITFVDDQDNVIGAGTREEAREKGIRHRVSRIVLVNSNGEVLLSRRSMNLSSNPGLWSVSAAGHVDEGETYEYAALREMQEEIGVKDIPLTEIGYFYSEGSSEHGAKQFARIYKGIYDGEVYPNPEEVSEVKWVSKSELDTLIEEKSAEFTSGGMRTLKFVRKLL
jgi:isopentenyl-diphosphate delta-isomerase type 1